MKPFELITLVNTKQPEAILRTLAMMAYNPAIGRVLDKGGVDRFAELMVVTIPKFYGLFTRDRFEAIHAEACGQILSSFKTNRGDTLSYGHAQKPLNVFLKVYVDWAKQPTRELAEKLGPLLHVPLDSLLMGFIAREFPEEYETRVGVLRKQLVTWIAERMNAKPRSIERMVLNQQFSLVGMNKEIYQAWQELLRVLYPGKPVALDGIWVMERLRLRSKDVVEVDATL